MIVPLNPTVMQQYRDALLVPACPSFIDTDAPVQPVSVIGGATLNAVLTGAGFSTPSSSQTPVCVTSGKAGNAVTAGSPETLHTVTSGKTFYLTAVTLGCTSTAGAVIELLDDATSKVVFPFSAATPSTGQSASFPTGIKFTNSVKIDVAGAAVTTYYTISGFEV